MSSFGSIAAIAVLAGSFGCTLSPPAQRIFTATIERIIEREEIWDYYSPTKGHKPLYCLYLRVNDADGRGRGELLRVLVLDLYAPGIHGQKDDTVSFLYRGNLPEGGEVDFESLSGYRIITKKG